MDDMLSGSDLRRVAADLARQNVILQALTTEELRTLADITYNEHEGFDGEFVEVGYMVKCMAARYKAVGLIPSRN